MVFLKYEIPYVPADYPVFAQCCHRPVLADPRGDYLGLFVQQFQQRNLSWFPSNRHLLDYVGRFCKPHGGKLVVYRDNPGPDTIQYAVGIVGDSAFPYDSSGMGIP